MHLLVRYLLTLLACTLVACSTPETPKSSSAGAENRGDLNPGRGYFKWSGMQVVPPHAADKAAGEVYRRFTWADLEPSPGEYQFAKLTALFDDHPDSLVAFRLRSMIDYGTADPADAIPRYVPSSIPGWEADTSGDGVADVFIPDWNSEAYLTGVERLWAALKTELAKAGPDGKPRSGRISWIDVGMFGQFGEWYLRTAPSSSGGPWVNYAQAPAGVVAFQDFENVAGNPRKRVVDAQISAFPGARWVMFFLYDQREVLNYLFSVQTITTVPVGWRFDALGADQFLEKQWELSGGKTDPDKLAWWNGVPGRAAFSERWKSALVVAEYFGSTSDPKVALEQVRSYHVGLVGNGNFTSGSGTDATHWSRVPESDRPAWAAVGAAAGWRLKAADRGKMTFGGNSFTWTGEVSNTGAAPAWDAWGGLFTFDKSVTVEVSADQSFPLPGEKVALTLTGTLPAGISESSHWSWVPTIRGRVAQWSGTTPSR